MNRKTALALAVASAFALSTFSTYADEEKTEAPKPEFTAQADETTGAPKPESPDQESPTPKPESPDLFA